jgi:putative membrane protein insertion efficiency factor
MKQVAKTLILQTLRGYKKMVSPMLMPACRYVPTCSEYALEAVDSHGVFRGSLLALWRVLRCHPFSAGGYDPVVVPKRSEQAGDESEFCSHRVS